VEDFTHCLVQILDRPDLINRTLTVGGAERLSYRQLVQMILRVTGRQRLLLPVPLKATRRIARFLLAWWHWPPASLFFLDRFSAAEVVELDAAQRIFGLQPARFGETITYLNRGGMRWRLFRR